jgi:transposase
MKRRKDREDMTTRRERRTFSEVFKQQIVQLHNAGKPRAEIIREYDISGSVFDRWVKRINATGSSREKDNRTPEQEELIRLRKENHNLKMENDILKQAALILGQK